MSLDEQKFTFEFNNLMASYVNRKSRFCFKGDVLLENQNELLRFNTHLLLERRNASWPLRSSTTARRVATSLSVSISHI